MTNARFKVEVGREGGEDDKLFYRSFLEPRK